MDMRDHVALVTGGGTGSGRAIALAFAREGMDVAINYTKSEAEAKATAQEARDFGRRAMIVRGDVSQLADVQAMVQRVVDEFGRIDVLVNNAGATVFVPFSDLEGMKDDDWDRIFAVNVKGTWQVSKAVVPIMKRQGLGKIINITSVSGLRAGGSCIAYSVSKGAESMLTKCLAMAVAPEIQVNAIAPGLMETRWGALWGEEAIERSRADALLKRLPSLDDVALAAVTLVKSESMTGQNVVVDGGRLLW